MIVGLGPDEQKIAALKEKNKAAIQYWNRECGVERPNKATPILLKTLLPLLKFMDLRVNEDLRDSLLFLLSFVCGFRGKEVCNLTWKDVSILDGGGAVLLEVRPFKNSTLMGSTHSCQFGRRVFKQVCMGGFTQSLSSVISLVMSLFSNPDLLPLSFHVCLQY